MQKKLITAFDDFIAKAHVPDSMTSMEARIARGNARTIFQMLLALMSKPKPEGRLSFANLIRNWSEKKKESKNGGSNRPTAIAHTPGKYGTMRQGRIEHATKMIYFFKYFFFGL